MARSRLPYALKSRRELKMQGTLDTNTVSNLLRVATKISLREATLDNPYLAPIKDVKLYEVYHRDTGERLPTGSHGDSTRIYETTIHQINVAPIAGHIAIKEMFFSGVGRSTRSPEMQLIGTLQASQLHLRPTYERAGEVVNILQGAHGTSTQWPLEISGPVNIGEDFSVGHERFVTTPTEQRDSLIMLGWFDESTKSL